MNIPEYITYKGKTHSVLGWAGTKYRLDNGTFAEIKQCTPIGDKVESAELLKGVTMETHGAELEDMPPYTPEAQSAVATIRAMTPKKAGRPRKNKNRHDGYVKG